MELQQSTYHYESSFNTTNVNESPAQTDTLRDIEEQLQTLLSKGGPDKTDYRSLDLVMQQLHHAVKEGDLMPHEIASLKRLFNAPFLAETVHGHGYRKPMGYAGDFLLIDKIYTRHTTNHSHYKKWDRYFHAQEATQAVRNRKEYFKQQMLSRLNHSETPLTLLDVASGPARDLYELYQLINPSKLKTTCIDIDARAISYASEICKDHINQINFVNKNMLRFSPTEKFDVIWSAGLFDYFDENIFVVALKKFLSWLKPGGEIIVGNFSEDNSSRGYMEVFGEWILIHRSKEELIRLSMLAGAKEENITVEHEPLGINLFLKIRI